MKALKIINPEVLKALADIDSDKKNLFVLLKQIADISSPTFSEKEKILFLQSQLLKLGYKTIIDTVGNLYGNIGDSSNKGKKLLVTAHTDTVLRPLIEVRDSKQYFFGHGVCDNSTGIAALLTILNLNKGIKLSQKVFADSEAAFLPKNHKIYQLTREVHNYLGLKSFFEMGNNDAEIALAKGIPAVTIGSSVGYKTHSLDEYVDKKSLITGIKQDLLVILNILNNF